jgi:hypothetical protein
MRTGIDGKRAAALPALLSSALLGASAGAWGATPPAPRADAVFVNGHVITLDARGTQVEALAVRDGRILATGSDRQLRRFAGPETRVVDLRGRTVLPGFVDGHAHTALAARMIERYLDGRFPTTPSVAVLLQRIAVRAATTAPGEWLIVAGSSSSQTRFAEKRLPTRAELDRVAPSVPVMFLNGSHEAVTNSPGVRALGFEPGVRVMKGAHIELDAGGEPTGVFQEGMMLFPDLRIPPDDLRRYYSRVIPEMWTSRGYTSVYTLAPLDQWPVLRELAQGAPATLRFTIGLHADPGGRFIPADLDAFALPASVDPAWYRLAGIKVWVDSDVPMRGGAVSEPYAGDPGAHGILNLTQEELDMLVLRTRRAGLAFLAHATGDRATAMALDAFERALGSAGGPARPGELRIEHFGDFMLGPGDLERARRLGVSVNVQPGWIYTLAHSTVENLGAERANGAFQFRAMIDAGLEPGFGTDLTGIVLETLDPFLHVWAAVTRNSDAGVFVAEQAVTVEEALRMLTIWAARAQGEDAIKGSLEPDKLADFVVISADVLAVPPAQLRDLKVLQTVVGGEVVYAAPEAR